MPQIMEADAWQPGTVQYTVEHVQHTIRRDRSICQRREEDVLTM